MTRRGFAALLAATVLMTGVTAPAYAMDITPMVSKITPTGSGSSYRMTIRNTSAVPATVEIEVYRMQVDDKGERSLVAEDNDIVAFPVQSVIPANREQVVQIRYIGDPIEEGRMYLVRAAQLPINMPTTTAEGGAGADVQVAFTINTYVFVAPARSRGVIDVTSVTRAPNGDILLETRNTGNGFAYLREAKITLKTADGKTIDIAPADIDVGQVSAVSGGGDPSGQDTGGPGRDSRRGRHRIDRAVVRAGRWRARPATAGAPAGGRRSGA